MPKHKGKVFVGMSGGVDSSVSAYLLKEQGYNVTGVHLTCWNEGGCSDKEERDARRVAKKLEIPFYVFDLRKEYIDKVVGYMVDGYKKGITPNPDVMCNKEIKFGAFLNKALEMGADYVATGHYARIKQRHGIYSIYAGKDKNKDQSYFLWTLTQNQLNHTLFPVGGFIKSEVREIARKSDLHVAEKKDSQGVCFVGQITLQEFLGRYLREKKGKVLNTKGEVVGAHPGAHFYTIGQRHGLGIALNEPHYVASTDIEKNTIILAKTDEEDLYRKEVYINGLNLNPDFQPPSDIKIRVRYRQKLESAHIEKANKGARIIFKKPIKFVAPGQSAVFYNNQGKLLGGGIIL
ncbi:MAG: tRNA 2-thiouridine(34) synthase MnmA [Candidatus Colwellbacteria bacterium CG10_big_fil_rev_8_21_14_0_10_42_22]|uniref:tRNA-specific 2-thiouridylase MnmA n=1 Tax=Candidatus Colwellbacteria bacterium CG10_big_fil_rev_8_21_14_0_10_42_22 TaxID=1974540 RepID=A0A2H0VG86_9BACT|nr:MAG: tRNA 2-thiouridine(34) synthase MnmA [Candidatus Colwellbacteria bacterium CG10_big_fil_rev_8_21_14_0_10_42_22]